MDKMIVHKLTSQFDELSHTIPDEDIEFWLARELQEPLGSGSERAITDEHVQNNKRERRMLGDRGIQPERLPPEEDIKKLERRIKTEEKRLEKQSGKLPGPDSSTKQEH